jgi:hypothetical protein
MGTPEGCGPLIASVSDMDALEMMVPMEGVSWFCIAAGIEVSGGTNALLCRSDRNCRKAFFSARNNIFLFPWVDQSLHALFVWPYEDTLHFIIYR